MSETMISYSQARNKQKIMQDEKELEELLKQAEEQLNPPKEEPKAEEPKEEPKEEKPKPKPKAKKKEPEEEDETEELPPEEKSFKKRYGDLKNHVAVYKKEIEELKKAQGNNMEVPTSEEELDAWIKKYPQVAPFIQAMVDRQINEKVNDRLSKLDGQAEEIRREKAEAKILKAHPDFNELNESSEFHDWAEEQPQPLQDALYDNDDPESVIKIINIYKKMNGLTVEDQKQKTKELASDIKTGGKTTPDVTNAGKKYSESQIKAMSDEEYTENEEAIMQAMADGNFIYDVTGGAR